MTASSGDLKAAARSFDEHVRTFRQHLNAYSHATKGTISTGLARDVKGFCDHIPRLFDAGALTEDDGKVIHDRFEEFKQEVMEAIPAWGETMEPSPLARFKAVSVATVTLGIRRPDASAIMITEVDKLRGSAKSLLKLADREDVVDMITTKTILAFCSIGHASDDEEEARGAKDSEEGNKESAASAPRRVKVEGQETAKVDRDVMSTYVKPETS